MVLFKYVIKFIGKLRQIEQDTKKMEQELSEKVSLLAENMLEKSLQGVFGEKEQKQIIGKALKNIKKVS